MGFGEILVIAVLALIFIGPKQLPDVARTLGRLLNEIKRAGSDFTADITRVKEDVKKAVTPEDLSQIAELQNELSRKLSEVQDFHNEHQHEEVGHSEDSQKTTHEEEQEVVINEGPHGKKPS